MEDDSSYLLGAQGGIYQCGLRTVQDMGQRRLVRHAVNKDSFGIFTELLRERRRKRSGGQAGREADRQAGIQTDRDCIDLLVNDMKLGKGT